MKTKPELNPGDRFYYYTFEGEKIECVFKEYDGDFLCDQHRSVCHYKAVQGVIRKRKLRGWWINEKRFKEDPPFGAMTWDYLFEAKQGKYIQTEKPENTDGWIFVREVKQKKEGK